MQKVQFAPHRGISQVPAASRATSTSQSSPMAITAPTDDRVETSKRQVMLKLGEQTLILEDGGGPARLGRNSTSALRFNTSSVSRRHAQFQVHKGKLCVRDLNSTHGTWVNEKKLKPGEWYAVPEKSQLRLSNVKVEWSEVNKDIDPSPGFVLTSETGRDFQLPSKWKPGLGLGREEGNLVRLHDTRVSRKHAELRPMPNGLMIRDLGSSHGTLVNGEKLEPKRWKILKLGETVEVGKQRLTLGTGRGQAQNMVGGPIGHVLRVYDEINREKPPTR